MIINSRNALLCALSLLLAACSTTTSTGGEAGKPAPEKVVADAALSPLNDLNLVRADIPEVLKAAGRNPYAAPEDKSCPAIGAAVQALDAALGPDLDAPDAAAQGLVARGTDAAGNAAVGALRGAAEGVVPFRGWVRKLTGAERYSRQVAAAIAAGTARRAYLKGLGQAAGCAPPAAPRVAKE